MGTLMLGNRGIVILK